MLTLIHRIGTQSLRSMGTSQAFVGLYAPLKGVRISSGAPFLFLKTSIETRDISSLVCGLDEQVRSARFLGPSGTRQDRTNSTHPEYMLKSSDRRMARGESHVGSG